MEGYVYILLNPAFPDMVKIGRTKRSSEERASEINSTGVPSPFKVVYEEYVSDCETVEKQMHRLFREYRVNPKREFFRVPPKKAVRTLQELAEDLRNEEERDAQESAVEILPELTEKHGNYLRTDITSVRVMHKNEICFLEVTSQVYEHDLMDEHVDRIDLSFIVDSTAAIFDPGVSVRENAERFVNDMDEYSIVMCTPLFTEEANLKIGRKAIEEAT